MDEAKNHRDPVPINNVQGSMTPLKPFSCEVAPTYSHRWSSSIGLLFCDHFS
jgi:hypothetical protein